MALKPEVLDRLRLEGTCREFRKSEPRRYIAEVPMWEARSLRRALAFSSPRSPFSGTNPGIRSILQPLMLGLTSSTERSSNR